MKSWCFKSIISPQKSFILIINDSTKAKESQILGFLMSYVYKTYTTYIYNINRPMKSIMKNINAVVNRKTNQLFIYLYDSST